MLKYKGIIMLYHTIQHKYLINNPRRIGEICWLTDK